MLNSIQVSYLNNKPRSNIRTSPLHNVMRGNGKPGISDIVCLFDLILYVPSTIFQLNRDGIPWVEPVQSYGKFVLLEDQNAVTLVRLEPAAPRSRVKHCTTKPLHSLISDVGIFMVNTV